MTAIIPCCCTEDKSLSISNIFSAICQDLIIQHCRENILQYSTDTNIDRGQRLVQCDGLTTNDQWEV